MDVEEVAAMDHADKSARNDETEPTEYGRPLSQERWKQAERNEGSSEER
jgi:hypothetical protein